MATCRRCGSNVTEGRKFCPNCGNPMPAPQQQHSNPNDFSSRISAMNNTADTTGSFDRADIEQNKVMAVLAYFGLLVFIPIFAAKGSRFARYHSNQGLVLLLACIAWSIVYGILTSIILAISWKLYFLTSILGLVSVVFVILAVIGIINAASGKAKELPLIGKFKILKF